MVTKTKPYKMTSINRALMKAIKKDDFLQIKKLVETGANLDCFDEERITPLSLAAGYSSLQVVKFLIKNGANVDSCDNWGDSVLCNAILNNKRESVAKYLMGEIRPRSRKNEFLQDEFFAAAEKNTSIEILLMAKDYSKHDVNDVEKWEYSALMVASRCNKNPKIVEKLIELGANINARDFEGATPLMHAACNYNEDLSAFELLIKAGADPTLKTYDGRGIIEYSEHWNRGDYMTDQINDILHKFYFRNAKNMG